MDPMETIIGQALMSGDMERGKRQAICNMAARTKIFCSCGDVLDQRTVQVLELHHPDGKEQTIAALCLKCRKAYDAKITELSKAKPDIKVVWISWKKVETV